MSAWMERAILPACCSGLLLVAVCVQCPAQEVAANVAAVSYADHVAPVLTKYCAGCHNDADPEGKFSVDSYAAVAVGYHAGPAFLSHDPAHSRIVQLMEGHAEPRMPPADEPQPTADEIALVRAWIEQGAAPPANVTVSRLTIRTPAVAAYTGQQPATALAVSPQGNQAAVGQFQLVRLVPLDEQATVVSGNERLLTGLPGKVTAVHFSADGSRVVASSGVAGRGGWAGLWEAATGSLVQSFEGQLDLLYDAELSPAGQLLATAGYDRKIVLWDVVSGQPLRTLAGHEGCVYDVAFSPDGEFLASASADDTVKVWRVRDGERMDTLSQPLNEAYGCVFGQNGRFIMATGADKKLRKWRFISRDEQRINPQVSAQFAHEAPIVVLSQSGDGRRLLTAAEDGTVKVWDANRSIELAVVGEPGAAIVTGLAWHPDGRHWLACRMDGSVQTYAVAATATERGMNSEQPAPTSQPIKAPPTSMSTQQLAEVEPNSDAARAMPIAVPARVQGRLQPADRREGQPSDEDWFRFDALAGESWVVTAQATGDEPKLDTFLEVRSASGEKLPRVVLQAVRESYFTFRGKNGTQVDDFRIFNWQEMQLNEYIYANGEVARLYRYPRGADSGFEVYPGEGTRYGYFDTTPVAHALGEPLYVVEAHDPAETLVPNGLPTMTLFYENDDDSSRRRGSNSRVMFTAPADGAYCVVMRDVRGFDHSSFTYDLELRRPVPRFRAKLLDAKPRIFPGTQIGFRVEAIREDGFEGPVTVTVTGLPAGVSTPGPVVIEAGQDRAFGILMATEDCQLPTGADWLEAIQITATADVNGARVTEKVGGFAELKVAGKPKLLAEIRPASGGVQPVGGGAGQPLEFEIRPGETIMLNVAIERRAFDERVEFGKEDAGRNLPFGVFVDNIGLNGLMITEAESDRDFFITCDSVAQPQSRLFHLQTAAAGGIATAPVLLHVRASE